MLMYMRLIIRESQKFNGMGWLTYDSVFRQNNSGGTSKWNVLDPSLHTAHIVQGGLKIVPCWICNGVDHSPDECVLAPLIPEVRPTCSRWDRDRRDKEARAINPPTQVRICLSWNRGQCRFLGTCFFRHICLACGGGQMQKDCDAGRQNLGGTPHPGPKLAMQRKV